MEKLAGSHKLQPHDTVLNDCEIESDSGPQQELILKAVMVTRHFTLQLCHLMTELLVSIVAGK